MVGGRKSRVSRQSPALVIREVGTMTEGTSPSLSLRPAFLIGDNLPMQESLAQSLGLSVVSQAWLNMIDRGTHWFFRRQTQMDTEVVWIHWGEDTMRLSGSLQRHLRDKLKDVVKAQIKTGKPFVAESLACHWPGLSGYQTCSVFTCNLGLEFCQHHTAMSSVAGSSAACICGALGGNRPVNVHDIHRCYLAVCQHLFSGLNPSYRTSTKEEIPPPYPQGSNPARRKVEFGETELLSVECSAFPTEQAIRQKEARKLKAEQFEASGLSPEEVKKALIKRKKFDQEAHADDCGSDTGPIDDATERSLYALSGCVDDAVKFAFGTAGSLMTSS